MKFFKTKKEDVRKPEPILDAIYKCRVENAKFIILEKEVVFLKYGEAMTCKISDLIKDPIHVKFDSVNIYSTNDISWI